LLPRNAEVTSYRCLGNPATRSGGGLVSQGDTRMMTNDSKMMTNDAIFPPFLGESRRQLIR
jgi:hypothetical protein